MRKLIFLLLFLPTVSVNSQRYFAEIKNDTVQRVIVVESAELAQQLCGGTWIETHINDSIKHYAGIGYAYRADLQNFVSPRPHKSAYVTNDADWDFYPMPELGTWIVEGDAYKLDGQVYQVRQSHYRTPHDPRTVPALFTVFQYGNDLHWIPGETVAKDSLRIYEAIYYKCLQTHTTQAGWEPPNTPSLWQNMTVSIFWTVGVAYKVNEFIIYQPDGFTYKCLQPHTSQVGWTPPAIPALWEKQ